MNGEGKETPAVTYKFEFRPCVVEDGEQAGNCAVNQTKLKQDENGQPDNPKNKQQNLKQDREYN